MESPWSNHYYSSFIYQGITWKYANNAIEYMKSDIFADRENGEKILLAISSSEATEYGKTIKNFNQKLWDSLKNDVIKEVLYAKFSQNPHLKQWIINQAELHYIDVDNKDTNFTLALNAVAELIKNETKI